MAEAWTLKRIESLISERVQEDLHLDYKAAGALDRSEKKKDEISKDVSAFANADGGVLIYGVSEDSSDASLPGAIDPIDSKLFSAEWLEQIVTSRIHPKVPGVQIHPVETAPGKVVYAVEVPKGDTAHQASDKRYYKRLGRTNEAMWDYEVRDVMNRKSCPRILIEVQIVQVLYDSRPTKLEKEGKERLVLNSVKLEQPKHVLRIRAANEGRLVANHVNVFVEIEPPLRTKEGEELSRLNCINTVRDTLNWSYLPKNGVETATRNLGPSRYEPILPGLSLCLEDFDINMESLNESTKLSWTVYADNAEPNEGSVTLLGLEVQSED